jgi:hypothetical protein
VDFSSEKTTVRISVAGLGERVNAVDSEAGFFVATVSNISTLPVVVCCSARQPPPQAILFPQAAQLWVMRFRVR